MWTLRSETQETIQRLTRRIWILGTTRISTTLATPPTRGPFNFYYHERTTSLHGFARPCRFADLAYSTFNPATLLAATAAQTQK